MAKAIPTGAMLPAAMPAADERLSIRLQDVGRPDVGTLAAVVARSEIVVRQPVSLLSRLVSATQFSSFAGSSAFARKPLRGLPAGFETVDAAVLDWIAGEARRVRRQFVRM